MRTGFQITWKVGKNKKSFTSESATEVQHKKAELISKGYKVTKMVQVIF